MTITWFYLIKPGLMVNPYKLFDIQITQSRELKYFIANIILLCCLVQSPRLLSLVLFDWSSQCGCHTILQITTIISSVNDCAALKRIDMVYHYLHHYLLNLLHYCSNSVSSKNKSSKNLWNHSKLLIAIYGKDGKGNAMLN